MSEDKRAATAPAQFSRLLISESPLQVLPSLAAKIGLNEAIFLQQIQYWLSTSRNIYEGRKWIYNSTGEWHEQFPFWSEVTIKRIVARLRAKNLILTRNDLNKHAFDRTLWFAINYDALDKIDDADLMPPAYPDDTPHGINLIPPSYQADTDNTNRLLQETSTEIRKEIVPCGTPALEPGQNELVRNGDSGDSPPNNSGATPPSAADAPCRPPTPWQQFLQAMCWVCHGHVELSLLTKEQMGALTAEAKRIFDKQYTLEDLRKWYAAEWKKHWKYLKNNSARPTPAEVRSGIAVIRSVVFEGFDEQEGATSGGWTDAQLAHLRALRAEGKSKEAEQYVCDLLEQDKQKRLSRQT